MPELTLVFLGGLLGSSHCLGMCGAFALSIGLGARSLTGNLTRQVIYSLGRISTYTFLGTMAGFAGWKMVRWPISGVGMQGWLAIGAGLLLIVQGLQATGIFRLWRAQPASGGLCAGRKLFASFLTSPRRFDTFLAGVLTGFLPCGLVYAYLALAASTAHPVWGGLTMALFGAGTTPLMVLAGTGATLLSLTGRKNLLRLAAISVVITGLITIDRGVRFAWADSDKPAESCPYCDP